MGYVKLLQLLLHIVGAIADIVRNKQLMDAGEAKATARNLAVITDRLGIGALVLAEVEALSDSDLDAELRGDK